MLQLPKIVFAVGMLASLNGMAQKEESSFDQLNSSDGWNLVFKDKSTKDWTKNWTLDGLFATVSNSKNGMYFSAGPAFKNDAHHAVMWTKESFSGDIKIEYDFTRTDKETSCVNILYIQATGDEEGPYVKDISTWSKMREVPAMKTYFQNMNALHISYAAFENAASDTSFYVRARRYPKPNDKPFDVTKIAPSYDNQGYFVSGQTYHITAIKSGNQLFFEMESKDGEELFTWDLSNVEPIKEGRIGLRHMYTRSSIYKNFKIFTK
jgi:hypothetical protein